MSFSRSLPRSAAAARRALAALALGTLVAAAAGALTYEDTYPVSEIRVEYALDHPRHIPVVDLLDLEVGLRATEDAYVAPRPVDRTVRMRLSALPRGASFGASAILHINQYIVSTFNRRGYNGVIVTVPDIEEGTGRDLRPPGDTVLRLRVWTGRISRVATVADGERFGGLSVDERTNHAAHAWIRERSPVRPGGPRGLLDVRALDDYAAEVSRHPGRRVDVELDPGERTGTTAVALRVAESKPWYAYARYTNTGTSTTTRNRESLGFVHNQLLSRDDILRVDYTTGDFDEVHAVLGSYEAPFSLDAPEWRWRTHGWWNQFDAVEAGFVSSEFSGEEMGAGAELSRQLLQRGELFVDAVVGADWQRMEVTNRQFASGGGDGGEDPPAEPLGTLRTDVDYIVPQVALRLVRDTATSSLRVSGGLVGGWTDDSREDLALLGNGDADDNFVLGTLDASLSFYLEPLLDRRAWEDPETPESSTLAHEIALAARGQYAFGNRLVPQFQEVVGGFYTVRGYKQSAASGDNLILGSLEYRFHLPRLFAPDATPPEIPGMGPFRARPPHVWAAPDWDLVFRLFTDAAHVTASHALESEPSQSLFSAGGGVELQVLRNLTLRADVGHVFSDVEDGSSASGDVRAHVAATLLY